MSVKKEILALALRCAFILLPVIGAFVSPGPDGSTEMESARAAFLLF